MISSFRNFAKTKFAGLLVFIMIIPFVFWGMGSMFSSGNTNNLAKINKTNISTGDFFLYLDEINIPETSIRENLDKDIIEELLSTLISTKLLDLEIEDFNILITEEVLLKKIKKNKNFFDEEGKFQRTRYEKFLLENNISAPIFEQRLRSREMQKNLFDYIGAGLKPPKFLIKKLYEDENKKLNLEFIDLKDFYPKKEDITDQNLSDFIKENDKKLKIEYVDFSYVVMDPIKLVGVDEFNQAFFDKIDQIEIDISNEVDFETITSNLDLKPIRISNFKFSVDKKIVEKKIFELRENKFDIFDNENSYVLYKIKNIEKKAPDINDEQIRNELLELISQKNKFDYNNRLLNKINNKEFDGNDFYKMGNNKLSKIKLNSIKDNKKFDINAVELLYSMPVNSLTLVNDEENNIFLVKIKNFELEKKDPSNDDFKIYLKNHNTNSKNTLLKSYDLFLNDKYKVDLNQKAIERVKNSF